MPKTGIITVAIAICVLILVIGLFMCLRNESFFEPDASLAEQETAAEFSEPTPSASSEPEINSANPEIKVVITDFEITGHDTNCNVGTAFSTMFSLVFLNNGTDPIDNVTVTFTTNSTHSVDRTIRGGGSLTHSGFYSDERVFAMGEPQPIGSISVGEQKQFDGQISNDQADRALIRGFAFIATLKSNVAVLDEAVIIIP